MERYRVVWNGEVGARKRYRVERKRFLGWTAYDEAGWLIYETPNRSFACGYAKDMNEQMLVLERTKKFGWQPVDCGGCDE